MIRLPAFRISTIICLGLLLYANTFHVPFVFDDIPNIRDNPHIRMTRLSIDEVSDVAFESPSSRRPVANLSFALNYLVHGDAVAGYHLVNIAVHVTTAVLLYFLLQATCSLAYREENLSGRETPPSATCHPDVGPSAACAFWGALIWLVHPLHTQTVTYIVQRMNGLAAMFYLLSMVSYARARTAVSGGGKTGFYSLCVMSGVLASGCKENALTLPLFIVLYEWYFFQDLSWDWLRKHLPILALLAVGIIAVVGLYLGAAPVERIFADYAHRDFTPLQRLLTQSRVVMLYLSLLAFPHPSRLNLDHQFSLSHSLVDPVTTLASAVAIIALTATAVVTARRHMLLSFGIWWFIGNLVIESSVIGLELVFEHRTYLPGMAVCALAAAGVYRWLHRPSIRLVLFVVVLSVFSFWTVSRNAVWHDDLSLWADSAAKSPGKARPQNKLGVALERRGRLDAALAQYVAVDRIDPNHPYANFNIGNIHLARDRLDLAETHYRRALHLVPGNKEALNNLGVVLSRTGRQQTAATYFEQAVSVDPDWAEAHRNLGGVLMELGAVEKAIKHLRLALKLDPADAEALYLLGNSFLAKGQPAAALSYYLRALEHRPRYAAAHTNAGIALASTGRTADAVVHFRKAVLLSPGDVQAQANLDRALKTLADPMQP